MALGKQGVQRRTQLRRLQQGRHASSSTASASRLTNAFHSSSSDAGRHVPRASRAGIRHPRSKTARTVYFAGDTCVFGDMQLIAPALPSRRLAVLPIGDQLHDGAGGGRARARAARQPALRARAHWGTFPLLTGTPDALAALTTVAGRSDRARGDGRAVRERWFGATGRRVPADRARGRARPRRRPRARRDRRRGAAGGARPGPPGR